MWRVTKTKHRKKDRKQGRLIEKTKKTSFINLPSLRKQPTFRHHWFPCEVTPETQAEKFPTDDLPILRSGHLIGWKFTSSNQKHYSNMGSGTPRVWNFCARFSGVISRGNHRWRRKMFSVFSGYKIPAVHANGAPSVVGGAPEPSINDIERPLKHQGTEWCVWSKQHPLFSHSSRCIPK